MLAHGFTVPGDVPSAGKGEKGTRVGPQAMEPLEKVIASVKSQMHLFASRVLVEAQFSETSKTIFERYQATVDRQLTNKSCSSISEASLRF
jgi:hypothetical protein